MRRDEDGGGCVCVGEMSQSRWVSLDDRMYFTHKSLLKIN